MPVRLFNHYVHLSIVLLGAVEAAIFVLSVYAGVYIRFPGQIAAVQEQIGSLFPRGVLYAVIMIVSMVSMGLYHARNQPKRSAILVRIGGSFALGSAILGLAFYAIPGLYLGRGAFLMTSLVAFVLVTIARFIFFASVDDKLFRRRVLVFGAGERAKNLIKLRRRSDQRGFNIIGFVTASDKKVAVDPERVLAVNPSLLNYCHLHEIDEIVVAIDERRKSFPVRELLDCKLGGIEVNDALTFLERETGKVQLDLLYPSWLIFSEGFRRGALRAYSERAFDIFASFLLLLLTWPIMLVTTIAIILDRGWGRAVLYRQKRVGYEGAVFEVLKFRSMEIGAEKEGQPRWAEKDDPRVTRVGRIIRKYRIDELPQILNVLRGDMAFVGPRPERPEFVKKLSEEIPYYFERHCVKPGITGWAQLCYPYGSSREDAVEKLQYDLYYVKNHSLLFDLMILLQTAEVVLWGHGAR